MTVYDFDFIKPNPACPVPFEVFETDVDLYYDMALSLYWEVEKANSAGRNTVVILPVGPVFQYRRFVKLCRKKPLDLSNLYCFFMDEYLTSDGTLIDRKHPLSFRGFIDREFTEAMPESSRLNPDQIYFPDPEDPSAYDKKLANLGNASVCYAGVGITGHLAFNEPPEPGETISNAAFKTLPSRVIKLARETIAINSNTAMRGAYEQVPEMAVTVGFKQILDSQSLRIYFNRPWQSAVVRKALFAEPSASFPVTLVREHPDVWFGLTREVAAKPEFALK